jgi:short-subunit dehydrogenase
MDHVLIIGAKSDIARAVAREFGAHGCSLMLAARNAGELEDFSRDLQIRHNIEVSLHELDVLDYDSHRLLYNGLEVKPTVVVSAVGYLGDQALAERDFSEARRIIDTNYTGVVSLFNIIAADFATRKGGTLIGISSVAGDRGRKSNYVYGSAKAALTTYLSGLRNRLFESGVHVLTVKPGFVATRMTEGMDLPERLTAQPDEVARDIYKAWQKKKNVVYSKWMWQWIMLIIRCIPEFQFKKMSI